MGTPTVGVRIRGRGADVFSVALGAGLGAVARYGVESAVGPGWGALWLVNVLGSALLGLLLGAVTATPTRAGDAAAGSEPRPSPGRLTPLLGTGFLGGFTTFSTAAVMALDGPSGVGFLVGMTLGCVLAAAGGWWLATRVRR